MITLVKNSLLEDLDRDALEAYRRDIESRMSGIAKQLLDYILAVYIKKYQRIDLDRIYSSKFIGDLITSAYQTYVWFNEDGQHGDSMRNKLNEEDIRLIIQWFRGYFDNLKKQYVRDDTFVKSNPHPHDKNVGDCVKRAIVHATGRDYMDVQRELNKIKHEIGVDKYNDRRVWRELCKRYNFQQEIIPPPKRGEARMNGHRFCIEHPKGTYILHMAHHLTCCIDGKIYDSWDCRDKAVYQAYKVKGE